MMMERHIAFLCIGVLALSPVLSQSAAGQPVAPQPGFVGMVKSSVAGCPNMGVRVVRHLDGALTGAIYYADISGVSKVYGSIDKLGRFSLRATPVLGKGPAGIIVGQRSDIGGLVADMKGEGCANAHLSIPGVPDMGDGGA
jgi:hypothetical protein